MMKHLAFLMGLFLEYLEAGKLEELKNMLMVSEEIFKLDFLLDELFKTF